MPSVEINSRKQKAVLYTIASYSEYGEQKVNAGVEIDVRWELQAFWAIDEFTKTSQVAGQVWVNQSIDRGSLLFKGSLAKVTSPATDLYEVVGYIEIPDIKGRHFERVVAVRAYKNALPTVVS
jgi:hypothetical protein